MKTFMIAISVTLVMICGICFYVSYLNKTAQVFLDLTKEISRLADIEEWEMCQEKINRLKDNWKKHKKTLSAFTDHSALDTISRTIQEIEKTVAFCDREETVVYANVLLIQIKRLVEDERPTWENILRHTPKEKYCILYYSRFF